MISPLDIRQHAFKRALRGYDTDEVQAFLTSVANEFQAVLQQSAELKLELERAKASISRYQETEGMLHKTLQQAELSSKAVVDNARREAELILQEADQRANEMLQRAYGERNRLDAELNDLHARRNEILGQLERFLSGQMDQVAAFRANEPLRLPRAEPPKLRQTRATTAQPLPSDPPEMLSANPPAANKPAAETPAAPKAPAEPAAPAQKSAPVPAQPDPAEILKTKRASFFEEALGKPRPSDVDDLVGDL